jgi:hypothetical protein
VSRRLLPSIHSRVGARAGAGIWLDETGRHKCMERAGVMGGAELDRETTEPLAGLARFSGYILGIRDEIRPDIAAGRLQVRYTLNVAAAWSLPPSPIARGSGQSEGRAR